MHATHSPQGHQAHVSFCDAKKKCSVLYNKKGPPKRTQIAKPVRSPFLVFAPLTLPLSPPCRGALLEILCSAKTLCWVESGRRSVLRTMRLWRPHRCPERPKEVEAAVSRAHWQDMAIEDTEAENRYFEVNNNVYQTQHKKVSCKISKRWARAIVKITCRPCLGQNDIHSGDRIRQLRPC